MPLSARHVIGTTQPHSYVYFRAGVRAQEEGRFADAEALYNRALHADPANRSAQVNVHIARLYGLIRSGAGYEELLLPIEQALAQIIRRGSISGRRRPLPDAAELTARYHQAAIKAYRDELQRQRAFGSSGDQLATAVREADELVRLIESSAQRRRLRRGQSGRAAAPPRLAAPPRSRLERFLFPGRFARRQRKRVYDRYLLNVWAPAKLLQAALLLRQAEVDEADRPALFESAAAILRQELTPQTFANAPLFETAAYEATRFALQQLEQSFLFSDPSGELGRYLPDNLARFIETGLLDDEEALARALYDPRFAFVRRTEIIESIRQQSDAARSQSQQATPQSAEEFDSSPPDEGESAPPDEDNHDITPPFINL